MAKYKGDNTSHTSTSTSTGTVKSTSGSKLKNLLKKTGTVFKKPVTWIAIVGISGILAVGLSVGLPMRNKVDQANNNLKKTEEVLDATTKDNQDKADIIAGLTEDKSQAENKISEQETELGEVQDRLDQVQQEKDQLVAEKEAEAKAEADRIAVVEELQSKLQMSGAIKSGESIKELTLDGQQYIKVMDGEEVSRIIKINSKHRVIQEFRPLNAVIGDDVMAQDIANRECNYSNENTTIYVSIKSQALEEKIYNMYAVCNEVSSIQLNGNDEFVNEESKKYLFSESDVDSSILAKVRYDCPVDYNGEIEKIEEESIELVK